MSHHFYHQPQTALTIQRRRTIAARIMCIIVGVAGALTIVGCGTSNTAAIAHQPDQLQRIRIYGPDAQTLVLWPDGSGALIVGELAQRSYGFPPDTFNTREVVASLYAMAGPPQPLPDANPPAGKESTFYFHEYAMTGQASEDGRVSNNEDASHTRYYPIAGKHRSELKAMIDKARTHAIRTTS